MSRDMKRRQSEMAPSGRRRGSTWIGLFFGLVIGIVLAAAVAWYTSRGATPFVKKDVVRDKPAATEIAPSSTVREPEPASTNVQPEPAPVALPGKPGDAPPTERRFQFYDILQGKSDPVPHKDPVAKPEQPAPDMKPSAQAAYLQAGAFSKLSDAENQKARLAMQGVESAIQQVMVQDKVLYRVRLGPYARPEDANRVKQELTGSGIEITTVK